MNDKGEPSNDKAFDPQDAKRVAMAAATQGLAEASELISIHYKQLKAQGLPDSLVRELTANFAEKFYEKVRQ